MNKMTRRTFMGAGAAAATIAIGQFRIPSVRAQESPGNNSSSKGVLNLYSARHYDTDKQIYQGFTNATGIQLNLIEAEADPLIERIKSEGANSPADVLITVDAGRLWRAEQEGLFQPIDSPVLKQTIPASLRHPEGLWFGVSKRARVIMYDKDKINPAQLSTYEDLADPKWRGQLLVRSSTNVYNQSLVGSILEAKGEQATEEWVRGVVANFARPPEGNDTSQIKACAAGVGGITIANTYYLARMMKSDDPEEQAVAEKIGVFFPNQRDRGAHVNISGAGVVKNAPNKESAIRFLEYLVSLEAQEIFAAGNHEYPVLATAPQDTVLTTLGTFKEDSLNASVFGRNNEEALRIMDRAGWV